MTVQRHRSEPSPIAGAPSTRGAAPDRPLRGRQRELKLLARVFHDAMAGQGGALVLHGEAGVGKTALLTHALRDAPGTQTLSVAGAEFEMELPFAALQQLCSPLLDRVPSLPPPQRAALEVAYGIRDEAVPNHLLIGLAMLGLLSDAGQEQTLICVVDDAHWLDKASADALAFAGRRLESERVAIVFAMRETNERPELATLPQLPVQGLTDEDARRLLRSEIHVPIDKRVEDRIIAEARGNPLALIELPRSGRTLGMAGGYAVAELETTTRRLEGTFVERMAELPTDSQMIMLVAAAEPLGDPTLLWRAIEQLGIAPAAVGAAEAAGLLEVDRRVRFRHPLVRSAVYRAAKPADRRRAHQALAEATDPSHDPDRRAWHRAQAAIGPDEGTAHELERSAERAQARGGLAAAAAFAVRAAELTPHASLRATRTLAAARAAQAAGSHDLSLTLLTTAESGPLDQQQRAKAQLQRAQIAFQLARNDAAAAMLIDAAGGLDGSAAREAYLEAFAAAMYVGRAAPGRLLEAAQAALAGPPAPEPPRPLDLLLDGLSANVALGYVAAIPTLQRAIVALRRDTVTTDDLRWLGLACTVAMDLRDDESRASLADLLVNRARATGALAVLPLALHYRAGVHLLAGELTQAAVLIGEAYAITAATGSAEVLYGDLALSAWRGDKGRVAHLIREATSGAAASEGRTQGMVEYATAILGNALGDYQTALDAATAAEVHEELGFNAYHPPELVEAAARLGRPEAAAIAIERLGQRAQASNTEWATGMDLRSRALLTDGPEAETLYLQAIDALGRTKLAIHVARTRLVYGEWLRRERRPAEAREQLRDAYETLSDMGALAFARRAARELQATGEHPRKRGAHLLDTLTAQELNIAQHAAAGATSKEIAATLFLSPRTIDAHLRNIFRKTGVTSRRQLRDLPLTGTFDATDRHTAV